MGKRLQKKANYSILNLQNSKKKIFTYLYKLQLAFIFPLYINLPSFASILR